MSTAYRAKRAPKTDISQPTISKQIKAKSLTKEESQKFLDNFITRCDNLQRGLDVNVASLDSLSSVSNYTGPSSTTVSQLKRLQRELRGLPPLLLEATTTATSTTTNKPVNKKITFDDDSVKPNKKIVFDEESSTEKPANKKIVFEDVEPAKQEQQALYIIEEEDNIQAPIEISVMETPKKRKIEQVEESSSSSKIDKEERKRLKKERRRLEREKKAAEAT